MYAEGSEECLKNAEHLFEDAAMLLENKGYGAAQGLIVTALEEAGKAIILELANLNYVGKEVVERSMRVHLPKKAVLLAMEKGLLFVDRIDRRNRNCQIDRTKMVKLENALKADFQDLENRRQNGFYVRVGADDGVIANSPNAVNSFEIEGFFEKAKTFLKISKLLCEFIKEYRVNPNRNNLRILQENLENLTLSYDEI